MNKGNKDKGKVYEIQNKKLRRRIKPKTSF
jgi:hypothetical protein